MEQALEHELQRVELAVIRVWQLLALLGLAGAVVAAIVLSFPLGVGTGVVAVALLGWASWVKRRIDGGLHDARIVWVSTLVESSLPWATLLLLVHVQGPAYALGSWLPPLLFAALIVASVARLRPVAPLLVGVSSAVAFLVLYFSVVRAGLPAAERAAPLFAPATQVTRAISLASAGLLAALLCRGLRATIVRAESGARAQDLFGKYRITRQIASGGMGTVHEALYCPEGGFERRVAIKRVHPHLAEQAEFVQAFRMEAELSARLAHPNIVQVFDFGRVESTYFLAMEYVDGLTLGAFLRRMFAAGVPLSPAIVARVGQEVLAGLIHSHEGARAPDGTPLRIIHRDLSPSNVLLSRTGEVKISDFGLARALYDAESARTKTVAGHVGYMAPEQALGQPLDPRCDLFGLGVVLWEMLAGRRLFVRENESVTLLAMLKDAVPPITALRPDVATAWDGFLERALGRELEERFASASDMAKALDAIEAPLGRAGADALGALVLSALELPDRRSAVVHEAVTEVASARAPDVEP